MEWLLAAGILAAPPATAQHNDPLASYLVADWVRPDWTKDLLAHVDANIDPSIPLQPMGWTEGLRFVAFDCWVPLPADGLTAVRRDYSKCNDSSALLDKRMHDVVWVLIRHEWDSYVSTVSQGQRRVAAWSLEQAIGEYRNLVAGAEPRSIEPQSTTLKRLRVIRGMIDEITSINDGDYQSDLERGQMVRDELNRQLALDGSGSGTLQHNTFQNIIGPLQKLTRDAMLAYISGVEAELNAKALAVLVYGNGSGNGNDADSNAARYLSNDERTALSLSVLARDRTKQQLYEFIRNAVIERPNAIGIAERYIDMKRSLFTSQKKAAETDANTITLRWPDAPDNSSEITLLGLLYTDMIVPVSPGEGQPLTDRKLEDACANWAERKTSTEGRCPFRSLADRALPAKDKTDTFGILKRERDIHDLLVKVLEVARKEPKYKKLAQLLTRLQKQTLASGKPVYALPYLARPLPTRLSKEQPKDAAEPVLEVALGEFNSDFCGMEPALLFQSNRCEAEQDAFDGNEPVPGTLSERLRRVIVAQPPEPMFEEKIAGLRALLKELAGELVDANTDTLVLGKDQDRFDPETFIGKICNLSGQFLPAMHRAGLRSVKVAPTQPGQGEVLACR